jgi:hypothetical protein
MSLANYLLSTPKYRSFEQHLAAADRAADCKMEIKARLAQCMEIKVQAAKSHSLVSLFNV